MDHSSRPAVLRRSIGFALPLVAWALTGCAVTRLPCAGVMARYGTAPAVVFRASSETSDMNPANRPVMEGITTSDSLPDDLPSQEPDKQPTNSPPPPASSAGNVEKEKKAVPVQPEEQKAAPEAKPAVKEEEEKPKNHEIWFTAHEQGTIITQEHGNLRSPYMGQNSLRPVEPAATTETATLYLDGRLWRGADIVFDPEISGGTGFSNTSGIAGFPNGEATRVGTVEPTPYIARLFFRQTWGFDGEGEKLEDEPNQLPGRRDLDRFTLSVGKMSATDVADNNRYSHDPRTQFQNWSLMYNGAWDYPANDRGYSYGVAADFSTVYYAVHYGIFAEPAVANGPELDPHFLRANGQILELEERYTLGDHPGRIREWTYLNHAHMGNYSEAIEEMPINPDITLTRAYRFKYGYGGNLEQEFTSDLGVFAKVGWNDGHSESWAFTEIDRTAALGLVLKGTRFRRPHDEIGLAGVINGLSPEHRDYLAHGGLGFIIGDGRLNYAPEQILELYYNLQIVKGINVTADFQGVNHPAYNADRGPVAIASLRVHFER